MNLGVTSPLTNFNSEVRSLENELFQLESLLRSLSYTDDGDQPDVFNEDSQPARDTACATRPEDDNQ
jgi:hypothetical protein